MIRIQEYSIMIWSNRETIRYYSFQNLDTLFDVKKGFQYESTILDLWL